MTYHASGGVVFAREHVPMTMERATTALAVHRSNRDHWLSRDDLAWADALKMAKTENDLAGELAAAIREASLAADRQASPALSGEGVK